MEFGRRMLAEWSFEPGTTYLNHGTVGVTPRRIMAVQQEIRDEIERHPSRFLLREVTATGFGRPLLDRPRLRAAADEVAAFLGARGDDLVFVDNATTGAYSVAALVSAGAGRRSARHRSRPTAASSARCPSRRASAAPRVRTVQMPHPFRADRLADAFEQRGGPAHPAGSRRSHLRRRARSCFRCAKPPRGCAPAAWRCSPTVPTRPGSIPVDIPSLGVDWYAANLHKWGWVPRNSGILWAAPARQAGLHPTVISWELDKGFTAEFDWLGTRDPSAHLSAPAAIALMREWGVEAIRAYNHDLAWAGAQRLADRWQTRVRRAGIAGRHDGHRAASRAGRQHARRGAGPSRRAPVRGPDRGADARLPGPGVGADFGANL